MQGLQTLKSHADLNCESVWFKAKLVLQFLTFSFLLTQPFYLSYLHAAPIELGESGNISTSGQTTTVNQTLQNQVFEWQSFNVAKDEKVNFTQPNSSSIALNRIDGNNGRSIINGQINADGQIILVNTSGVFFTSTSTINVGGLVASSLDMTPSDFMNGNYIFNDVIGTDGTVINGGIINASMGGNVVLIGKQVKNEGLISANLGSVVLAAGKQSILTFDSQGLLGVKVTKEVLQDELGLEEAVINNGDIKAEGGRVLLTASTSQDVFSQAVNTNNLNQATSVVVNADGSFTLGGGADVLNSGSIDVSSESNSKNTARIVILGENVTSSGNIKADVQNGNAGEIEIHAKNKTLLTENSVTTAKALSAGEGGIVKVLGEKVGLLDSSIVDASGINGGGEILIGGDQEGRNNLIRNAQFIYIGAQSQVKADAIENGDGGKIITFAENGARIYGNLYARGGIAGGNGGFIETSGLLGFDLTSVPDASAYVGENGTWLIDPYDITITNNTQNVNDDGGNFSYFDAIGSGAEIHVDDIKSGLSNGDVIIRTTRADGLTPEGSENGDITIEADIDFDGVNNGLATLTLDADRNITLNSGVKIYDSASAGQGDQLDLNLYTRGDVLLDTGSSIVTHGGKVTVGDIVNNIVPARFTNKGTINTTGGTNQSGGGITITTSGVINNTETGIITANGGPGLLGSADAVKGYDAGAINLTSSTGTITIDGAIKSEGGAGAYDNKKDSNLYGDGGAGGAITIESTSGNIIVGADVVISSKGHYGAGDTGGRSNDNKDPAKGGAGGKIEITTAGTLNVGILNTSGGNGIGGNGNDTGTLANGGNAGEIILSGSTITLNNSLNANGGISNTPDNSGTRGDGNNITLTGNTVLNNPAAVIELKAQGNTKGDIKVDGSLSSTTPSQDNLTLDGKDITFTGDVGSVSQKLGDIKITASGTVKAESTVPEKKNIYAKTLNVTQSGSFTAGNIDASAGDGLSTSKILGTENSISIFSDTLIDVGDISSNAGATVDTESNGFNGASITLAANDITVGDINTFGTDASTNTTTPIEHDGGNAGSVTLTATGTAVDDTPSITLKGNINAKGGSATNSATVNGTSGSDGSVNAILVTDSSGGTGSVSINYAGVFTSLLNITGSSGTDTLTGSNRVNDWRLTAANDGYLNTDNTDILVSPTSGVMFTGFETLTGSTTNSDTLTGHTTNNAWDIDGAGTGTVTGLTRFNNMNNLVGNSGDDDFTISGSLTGSIDGGGDGTDANTLTIETSNQDMVWNIDGTNSGTDVNNNFIGDGFSNIHQINGGDGNDAFTITSTGSIRDSITGGGQRTVAGDTLDMSAVLTSIDVVLGIKSITPKTTDLNIAQIETVTGNNDGSKALITSKFSVEAGHNNTWNITGANEGNVTNTAHGTVRFIDFTDINGSDADADAVGDGGNDRFNIAEAGSMSGLIDAGTQDANTTPAGRDILDLSAKGAFILDIGTIGTSTKYQNFEEFVGNNSGTNQSRVIAANTTTSWTIDGNDSGSVSSSGKTIYFTDFNYLQGGSGDDNFTITADGSISGLIDGGNAAIQDQLTVTAPSGQVDIALGTTQIVGANNITNIERVTGDGANVTLIGESLTQTTWNITGVNEGDVNYSQGQIDFFNVSNLTGNTGKDSFVFGSGTAASISITGVIQGGDSTTNTEDDIDMSQITDAFTVELGTNILGIEAIKGNNNATLKGDPNADANFTTQWLIDSGENDGQVDYVNALGGNESIRFEDFNNIQGQDDLDDVFTITGGNILGKIDGGGGALGTGIDSVNYELSNITEVIVGSSTGIGDIEQVIGKQSITLKGVQTAGIVNTWVIENDTLNVLTDGNNDGLVSYDLGTGDGLQTLSFVNFGALEAGTAGDSFTIHSNGSFTGTITGGIGNDTFTMIDGSSFNGVIFSGGSTNAYDINAGTLFVGTITGSTGTETVDLTLSGTQTGTLIFNGNATAINTLNIDGDSDDGGNGTEYFGSYFSDIDALHSDKFVYTNAANTNEYTIQYSNADTVQDNLIADTLTVNGTQYNDVITLDSTSFQVSHSGQIFVASPNQATRVDYTNKNNLVVDALAGTNDEINLTTPLDFGATGTVELSAEKLTLPDNTSYTGALITARSLKLDSINIVSSIVNTQPNTIQTDITSLAIANSGAININEVDAVDIENLSTNDLVSITAGEITSNSALISNAEFSITALNGDIALSGNNQLSGELSLITSINNDVSLVNTTETKLDNVFTRDLTIYATGATADIHQIAAGTVESAGLATLNSSGNIILTNTTNNFDRVASVTLKNLDIQDIDSIGLNSITAVEAKIVSGGEILDSNSDTPGDNVIASNLTLSAASGIGDGNALETRVSNINVETSAGQIEIDNVADVSVEKLVSNGGSITFINTGNVEISKIDAGYDTGSLNMTVLGGSVTGERYKDYIANPDITAYNANILVPAGIFGTATRPISVKIKNRFSLFSLQSAVDYTNTPPTAVIDDSSTAKISITDAFSSLAGQQLIEVESIGDIDPAIFTDVRNYSHSDLALMMPSDQRYDVSDDEEEDEDAKEKRNKLIHSAN